MATVVGKFMPLQSAAERKAWNVAGSVGSAMDDHEAQPMPEGGEDRHRSQQPERQEHQPDFKILIHQRLPAASHPVSGEQSHISAHGPSH